jgi:uncharacterized coiled-coil protein SlyX
MNEQYRTCPECGKQHTRDMFLPVSNSSFYGIDGTSYTCIECVASKIDRHDLGSIDKMCQFLDLPFDANRWLEMEKQYEKLGPLLIDYCQEMTNGKYVDNDWFEYNKMWEKCREYNGVLDKLTAMHSDLLMFLRKKWGHIDGFTLEEYMRMEEYERHTLSHYPFKDEARRDMVRKLAKLSAISDHCIANGDNKEATTVLQSYNTLMKELGISTQTASNENTIESLSELVAYLEKTGFLLNYKITENRDVVDKTIENMQQYVRRLFTDSSETVNEMYNSKMLSQDGGTDITDEDIENLYAASEEDGVDYEDPMDEKELENMFLQVENEFK